MELPSKDATETVKNVATAVALVVGGIWAFWKWSLSAYLRHRREMPSFEGEMTARVLSDASLSKANHAILTVTCKWKNVSAIPLNVNTKETRFTVFEIPPETPPGPVGPRLNNLKECFVRRPWEHWPSTILEPGTNSEVHAHFVVEEDKTYIIACRLEAVQAPKKQKQVWVRELVWSAKVVGVAAVNAETDA